LGNELPPDTRIAGAILVKPNELVIKKSINHWTRLFFEGLFCGNGLIHILMVVCKTFPMSYDNSLPGRITFFALTAAISYH
jgi:hypothetical protein